MSEMIENENNRHAALGKYIEKLGDGINDVLKYTQYGNSSSTYFSNEFTNEKRLSLIKEIHALAIEAIKELK